MDLAEQYIALRHQGYSAENAARELNIPAHVARPMERAVQKVAADRQRPDPWKAERTSMFERSYEITEPLDYDQDVREQKFLAKLEHIGGYPRIIAENGKAGLANMFGRLWAPQP
jgi:hypothetical protein